LTADNSVVPYSNAKACAWPKIWTLSARLSLMRNVQLMKKNKNIFRVYYIRIIATTKLVHTTWNRQIPQWSLSGMCACLRTSAYMIVYLFFTRSWLVIIGPKLFFTRSWSAIIGTKQPKVNQSPQQWWGWYTCTQICRFLVVENIFRLETCMNSLVKVSPYYKLNFQGKIVFTQNWCNITLKCTHFYLGEIWEAIIILKLSIYSLKLIKMLI
jgi:hypothetical protein